MTWYPRTCPHCKGDLYDDAYDTDWVTCLSCARSYPRANVDVPRSRPIQRPLAEPAA
jgi:hypothetical protein